MLSLRDRDSHDYCLRNSLLSAHRGLVYSADPVMDARFDPAGAMSGGFIPEEPYALVIPKPTGDLPSPIDDIEESAALAVLLEHCIEATGLAITLLPFHPAQDLQMCMAAKTALNNRATVAVLPEGTVHPHSHAWQLISGASLVISYRLHGLVSAAANGIPAMGVAYDPKVSSICNELGLPCCFPATVHEMDSLDDLRRLWNSRNRVIEHMNTERENMLLRLKEAEQKFDELW